MASAVSQSPPGREVHNRFPRRKAGGFETADHEGLEGVPDALVAIEVVLSRQAGLQQQLVKLATLAEVLVAQESEVGVELLDPVLQGSAAQTPAQVRLQRAMHSDILYCFSMHIASELLVLLILIGP